MDLNKVVEDASRILHLDKEFGAKISNNKIVLETEGSTGDIVKSFIPAALYMAQLSSRQGFIGSTREEEASVYQWLEYCVIYSLQSEKRSMLKQLDLFLKDKVYFVGNQLTIADLLFYLTLHDTYSGLSFQEKELYFNLSRWFRQVQNGACANELYPKICFAKTKMYN